MTGFYLYDHPPASPQFRSPRRERLSGIVPVHTSESVMDDVGPDTGAENVASFISGRGDPGSYHVLVDSDSPVPMVPDGDESYQVATDGHNRHAWGISFACRSSDLNPDADWTRQAMRIAGAEIRAFWIRNGFDPASSARWLSRDDAVNRRGPGLVTHGLLQPADRSDAWTNHPRRGELERMLVAAITEQEPDDMPITPQDADMIAGRVRDFLASPETNRTGTIIDTGARESLAAVNVGLNDPAAGARALIIQLLNRPAGSVAGVDPAQIASAIGHVLGADLAGKVADELSRRLGL